jgi:predicted phosphodiesterase
METYKVLVLPDTQLPYQDVRTMNAIEQFIAENRFDEWLQLGDFMDFHYASKWTKENLKVLSTENFYDDYQLANEFLDRHQTLIRKNNPKAKFTLIQGNHDIRPEKVIEKDPRFRRLIAFEDQLHLKERKINFVPFWRTNKPYRIGKAYFIHGLYVDKNHARKTVDAYGVNVFYGHTHDIQLYSKVLQGKDRTVVGQSLGCLCNYNLDYMGHRPSNWQQAFAVFEFFPDGYFTYQVYMIFKHRFRANGKTYQG